MHVVDRINMTPQTIFRFRGSYGLGKGALPPTPLQLRSVPVCALSFLLTDCGLGEGQVAPVYVEWSAAPIFVVKHYGFDTFCVKNISGGLGVSGLLLGAS